MKKNCDEIKLQIQTLADGENLVDDVATKLFLHLSSCKACRDDYFLVQTLNKKLKSKGEYEVPNELFIKFERSKKANVFKKLGFLLIIVSYIIILTIGILSFFAEGNIGLLIKGSYGAIITGIIILLLYTIVGRIKESKNDKYKEIIR